MGGRGLGDARTAAIDGDVTIEVSTVRDFEALGMAWRELETRSAGSFFQSWTWTGCLYEERFDDPVLVSAHQDGRVVAMGLCNRRRRFWRGASLHLGETGREGLDGLFIEHNGFLIERGQPADLSARLAGALFATPGQRVRRISLNGVSQDMSLALRSAGLSVAALATRPAWIADVSGMASEQDYLVRRSANTRQSIRRAIRWYERDGPISVRRADTVSEATAFLGELETLHQTYWRSRGQPGAFAEPFFGRFHHALLGRGVPRGEVDVLRICAGTTLIGLLYNFCYRDTVSAYQSGLAYGFGDRRQKPGLVSHTMAIGRYGAQGYSYYDFLAGDAMYKRSLADDHITLAWVDLRLGRYPAGVQNA